VKAQDAQRVLGVRSLPGRITRSPGAGRESGQDRVVVPHKPSVL